MKILFVRLFTRKELFYLTLMQNLRLTFMTDYQHQ